MQAYNVALELYDLVLLEHVVAFLDRSFAKFKKNANPSKSEENYYEMFTGIAFYFDHIPDMKIINNTHIFPQHFLEQLWSFFFFF